MVTITLPSLTRATMKADIAYLIGWLLVIVGAAMAIGVAGALMAIGAGMMICSMHASSMVVSLFKPENPSADVYTREQP